MSKNYEITVDGHPNIYNKMSARKLNICFSEPEEGVQAETGVLMLIPGFGGNLNSNVYKKMRTNFADKYNLVTIQCDYFGLEFMQADVLEETIENFNDLGPLQAMDIISSVMLVQAIMKDNNLVYNTNKIIAYGHSHGAYLAYLANAFAPNLFSYIIDNSGWLMPQHLFNKRVLIKNNQRLEFDYAIKNMKDLDLEIYNLKRLYKRNNNCFIQSFHGSNDNLISLLDKRDFILPLKNSCLHEITEGNLNEIFRSNAHGLDADYIKMFDYVMMEFKPAFKKERKHKPRTHRIETSKFSYLVNFDSAIAILSREKK